MSGGVIVIGGGAAGALTALAARRAGADVTLVRRAPGASSLSSGAFDVAAVDDHEGRPLSIIDSARALARRRPRHPYARVGSSLSHELGRALEFVKEALGLRGAPESSRNLELVTPLGTVKRTALAAPSIARGDLAAWPVAARLGVVEVFGHAASDATLPVAGLRAFGRDAVAVSVRFELEPAAGMGELAANLDSPAREAFVAKTAAAARDAGATHLLLPTAGFENPDGLCAELESFGVTAAAERLATPPSVPGLRFNRALERALEVAGVKRVVADVVRATCENGRVVSLALRDGVLSADAFVLASGRFIGGGVRHEGSFKENVFGLPVFVEGTDVRDAWMGDLLDRKATAEQPAMTAGIAVDARMRPIDERERVCFGNLFAAGSVIGGYDAARDASGLGVAALTALIAGESAAAAARDPVKALVTPA